MTEYQAIVDAQWTDKSASTGASSLTSVEEQNQGVRDRMIADGIPVTSAKSDVRIIESSFQDDGTVLVVLDVSTTFLYSQTGSTGDPGIVSDRHNITLTGSDSAGYSVVEDVVVSSEEVGDPNDVPDDYAPKESSANKSSSTTSAGGVADDASNAPADTAAVPVYNTTNPDEAAMSRYAKKWTSPPYDGDVNPDDFNPDFPVMGNNCANFASQVLHAGGWEYDDGVNPRNTANWSPDLSGPFGPSRTWVNSSYQYTYVLEGSYVWLDNVYNAAAGDLLYVDWDPDGKADGTIDHVMVVSSVTVPSENPRISQKTPNRSNIPIEQSMAIAAEQGKTDVNWYGLKRG
ncbi:amidase domain-containing protein [Actinomyces slackii]|uniref:amidase domain-containing protein n=1 Tax=Actinomyces slackii TaxID=52774 RepID=UPI00146FC74B|nr:amidase domain-containing protein [Actinomyces slackii]